MTEQEWLTLIKTHLRIDSDYTEEDTYLLQLRDVALEAVNWQVDRPTEEMEDGAEPTEPTEEEEEEPKALLQAALLLIGELYEHREVTGDKATQLPKAFDYLVGTKRRYTVG